ncbi:MAG: thioesterase family protein [Myxococcales bacterium]|nr:thioesterase family protein [Myxococcales bacterium]
MSAELDPERDVFFEPDGEDVVATPWTRGPWDLGAQHGGPPSALAARAVETCLGEERGEWLPGRTAIEILRPVPIARLRARAEIVKRGRSVLRARAVIEHEGVEVLRARCLLLRRQGPDDGMATPAPSLEDVLGPTRCQPFTFTFFLHDVGYHRAMEIRIAGGWPESQAIAWARLRVPLVAGESPSGWQRALCFADAAHGVAPALDPRRFTLVNPDLELALSREPRGEWIGLEVTTVTASEGVGLTRSLLRDEEGAIGGTSATLVVRHR